MQEVAADGALRQRDPRPLARAVIHLLLDHLRGSRRCSYRSREPDRARHHRASGAGLGEPARRFTIDRRRLAPGERLLLVSDGVLDRRTGDGQPFGLDGVRTALARAVDGASASTVRALEDAITAASTDPLEDDATIVVFAPTSSQ